MMKMMKRLLASILCGVVFFYGAILLLMELGLHQYGNYEYYGQYPALFFVPGIIGLLLPWILAWLWEKKRKQRLLIPK